MTSRDRWALAVDAATPAAMPLAQASPEVAARYGASYTVKPGDSLYGIARAHKVKFSELQQVNGISDPRRVNFVNAGALQENLP